MKNFQLFDNFKNGNLPFLKIFSNIEFFREKFGKNFRTKLLKEVFFGGGRPPTPEASECINRKINGNRHFLEIFMNY